MKKISVIIIALFATITLVQAQNSKVTSGVIAYDNGRFEESIEKLETALANKADLKEKNIPKAHMYLCRAYLAAAGDSSMLAKYPDAATKAYENYELAKATDEGGKLKNLMVLTEQNLWPAVFNAGAIAYNEEDYEKSKSFFEKAIALSPADLNSHIMLGYSNWMKRDTAAALSSLSEATRVHKENLGEEGPNDDVARAYLMIAAAQDGQGESEKALETLAEARELYPTDKDLQKVELSIYQKNPSLFERSKAKFEQAMKDNPDDNNIKLAYADLLDKNGDDARAEAIFGEVLAQDPDNLNANIQMGARYINKAAEISKEKMEMTKEADIDKANEGIREMMRKAEPFMKKMHELEPKQMEWINQMISIAYILDYSEEEIAKLEAKAKEIREGGK